MPNVKDLVPDMYTLYARYVPALIIALPVALAILAIASATLLDWDSIWAVIVWCGGAILVWEIGRDMGKSKQSMLFEMWGGKPTTRMLRHRNTTNQTILNRRHRKLEQLMGNLRLPTPEQEEKDPQKADDIYEACGSYLRSQTRDTEKFPLIFKENCSYGFRRNLWGMKKFGIVSAIAGLIIIFCALGYKLFITKQPIPITLIICGSIDVILLLLWILWLKPEWVKIAAEAYSERVLEAIEQL
jgi:hypothetical protein